MKRVNFGHKGGFPLEQETLIHLQRAYANDMLEGLMAHWGIDPTQNYRIKQATSDTDDGWIITTITREEIDAELGTPYTVTKPELIRLKFNGGLKRSIEILDIRAEFLADGSPDTSGDGYLEYADGQPKRVYEEWLGQYVNGPTRPENKIITNLIPLKTIIELTTDVTNINTDINSIKEDYLPRDGSKPMTGGLVLGEHKPVLVPNQEGNRLYFRGTFANTDEVYISKHTPSSDITELRVNIGDNAQTNSKDVFTIGGAVSGQSPWKEQFRVQTDGKVGVKVTDPVRNLDIDAENNFLRLRNLRQVTVNQERPLVLNSSGDLGVASQNILTPPTATTTRAGIAEIATRNEIDDGEFADRNKIVSPYYLGISTYAQRKLYGELLINGIGSTNTTVTRDLSGVTAIHLDGPDSCYRVNFSKSVFGTYVPIVIIESNGQVNGNSNFNRENDAILTFDNLRSNSMDIIFREVSDHGLNQFVKIRIQIIN